jgi:hypothetical protein
LLIGVSLCEVLELAASFPTSPSSLKMEFICISYCVFGFGGFTGSFLRKVLTSLYLIFFLLLILGLYVVHWIDLSLSFSKSSSLLKSESGRKSYHHFCLLSFSVGANPVLIDEVLTWQCPCLGILIHGERVGTRGFDGFRQKHEYAIIYPGSPPRRVKTYILLV